MTFFSGPGLRKIIAIVGVSLVLLGVIFAAIPVESGKPPLLALLNGARDLVLGSIVVLGSYRFASRRAGWAAVIVGGILAGSTAVAQAAGQHFTPWTGLHLGIALILAALGGALVAKGRPQS